MSSRVYAFDGQAGQDVVGEISGTVTRPGYGYAYGRLYTAEGDEVGSIDFQKVPTGPDSQYLYASSFKLPATGSYRLVLEPYIPMDQTLTLWDLSHAPDALRKAAAGNSYSREWRVHVVRRPLGRIAVVWKHVRHPHPDDVRRRRFARDIGHIAVVQRLGQCHRNLVRFTVDHYCGQRQLGSVTVDARRRFADALVWSVVRRSSRRRSRIG